MNFCGLDITFNTREELTKTVDRLTRDNIELMMIDYDNLGIEVDVSGFTSKDFDKYFSEKPVYNSEKKDYNINNESEGNHMTNVKSSWIRAVSISADTLIVKTISDETYLYFKVPYVTLAELSLIVLSGGSVGSYINRHIIGKFETFKKC